MANEILIFDTSAVAIDRNQILRDIGYPSAARASKEVLDRFPIIANEVALHSRPQAITREIDRFAIKDDSVILEDGATFHGPLLCKALSQSAGLMLFALTLGPDISKWISEQIVSDPLAGVMADACASELVEAIADHLEDGINTVVRPKGLVASGRYSPGYCDWPINELPLVIEMVEASKIGITLSSGGMMIPRKSICGLVATGPESAALRTVPCESCARDCPYRRGGRKGAGS